MEKGIRCISGALIAISISLLLLGNWIVAYGDTRHALKGCEREYRQLEKELAEEVKNEIIIFDLPPGQSERSVINDIQEMIDLIIDGKIKTIEIAKISRFAIKYSDWIKNEIEQNSYYLDSYYVEEIFRSINKIKFWSVAYIACLIGAVLFGAVVFICRLAAKRFRGGYIFFIFNIALVVLVFIFCKGLKNEADVQLRLTFTVWLALALAVPLPLKRISRRISQRQRATAYAGKIQVNSRDIGYWECKACGAKNRNGSKFCYNCGDPFESEGRKTVYCQVCGNKVVYGSKFCPKCGAKLFKPRLF